MASCTVDGWHRFRGPSTFDSMHYAPNMFACSLPNPLALRWAQVSHHGLTWRHAVHVGAPGGSRAGSAGMDVGRLR